MGNHYGNEGEIKMSAPTISVNVGLMRGRIAERYIRSSAFAEVAGVSRQYISRVLLGETIPTVERLVQFADLLGVKLDDLIVAPKVIAPMSQGVPVPVALALA